MKTLLFQQKFADATYKAYLLGFQKAWQNYEESLQENEDLSSVHKNQKIKKNQKKQNLINSHLDLQ